SEPVAMEPQVFDLLLYLLQNRDRVVSRDDLIASVWNGRIVSESTLSTRITAARKAIGDTGEDQILIKTYPRKGIRFVGDLQMVGVSRPNERGQIPAVPPSSVQTTPAGPIEWGSRPSVAVLPFNNLSGDAEQDYFSDGITEDIITALSKYRSLAVIARNSSFAFKGAGGDTRSAGLTLGADYLVDGSVRKTTDRVRVTTQLVETETGRQLWAERYDRDLKELFDLQDEITTAIAGRIEPEVSAAERMRRGQSSSRAARLGLFPAGHKALLQIDSGRQSRGAAAAAAGDRARSQSSGSLWLSLLRDRGQYDLFRHRAERGHLAGSARGRAESR
ncbi:MAG: winged helix-turn-helix domain-containing protein, partial [Pseudolabrys sp.]